MPSNRWADRWASAPWHMWTHTMLRNLVHTTENEENDPATWLIYFKRNDYVHSFDMQELCTYEIQCDNSIFGD